MRGAIVLLATLGLAVAGPILPAEPPPQQQLTPEIKVALIKVNSFEKKAKGNLGVQPREDEIKSHTISFNSSYFDDVFFNTYNFWRLQAAVCIIVFVDG